MRRAQIVFRVLMILMPHPLCPEHTLGKHLRFLPVYLHLTSAYPHKKRPKALFAIVPILSQGRCGFMNCKALSLAHRSRADRLAAINELLVQHNLRPLPDLGDNSRGWPEITDILEWDSETSAPFHDIVFLVRRTNGKEYPHTVRFNTHGRFSNGVLFIPEINGLVALTRQFRIAIGAETWELARGFSERNDTPVGIQDPSLPQSLVRELGEEVIRDAHITSVTPLGAVAENTGTHNSWIDTYIVRVLADTGALSKVLGGTQQLGVKFVTWGELFKPTHLQICDLHSLAVIALAHGHRN